MEETGLEVVGTPKLLAAQDIIPNTEKHVVRLSYVAEAKGEMVLDTAENTEYVWLTLDELKNYNDVDNYVKELLNLGLIENRSGV